MSSKWTEKEIDMIDEMVNREVDMMDMEGLIQYAKDNLSEYLYKKSDEEVDSLYEAIGDDDN